MTIDTDAMVTGLLSPATRRFPPVLTRPQNRWVGPAQPDEMIHNVHFHYRPGTKLVEERACNYCWATFTQKRTTQYHCSPACSKRDGQWDTWVRVTRREANYGRRGPALPPAGAGLAAAIAPFAQPELLEAAS